MERQTAFKVGMGRYGAGSYYYSNGDPKKICLCVGLANLIPWIVIAGVLVVVLVPVVSLVSNTRTEEFRNGHPFARQVDLNPSLCSGVTLVTTSSSSSIVTIYGLSETISPCNFDPELAPIVHSCSAGRGSVEECTIPNDDTLSYLLYTDTSSIGVLEVTVKCQLNGGVVFGIILAGMAVLAILSALGILGVCLCARKCQKMDKDITTNTSSSIQVSHQPNQRIRTAGNIYYSQDCNGKICGYTCMIIGLANSLPWIIIAVILGIVFVPLGIYLGNIQVEEFPARSERSRIVTLNPNLCSGVTLNVTSFDYTAQLYALSSPVLPATFNPSRTGGSIAFNCSAGGCNPAECTLPYNGDLTYILYANNAPTFGIPLSAQLRCQLNGGITVAITFGVLIPILIISALIIFGICACSRSCINREESSTSETEMTPK